MNEFVKVISIDGKELDSKARVGEHHGMMGIFLESRSGASKKTNRPPRNPDYEKALESILTKLYKKGETKLHIWVASKEVERDIRQGKITFQECKIINNTQDCLLIEEPFDARRLRIKIGNTQARVNDKSTCKGGGTGFKKIFIYLPNYNRALYYNLLLQSQNDFIAKNSLSSTNNEVILNNTTNESELKKKTGKIEEGYCETKHPKDDNLTGNVEPIYEKIIEDSSQAFQNDSLLRKAIEKYSMTIAIQYFKVLGWQVEDVSQQRSYDLYCTRQTQELYVEVKGTTSDGSKILLTPNEVAHNQKNYPKTCLFIVSHLEVQGLPDDPKISGGEINLLKSWFPDDKHLKPTGFEYTVPNKLSVMDGNFIS